MFKHVKWTPLPVTNQDRALAFYRDRLGFRVHRDRPYTKDSRWIEIGPAGAATRLLFTVRPNEERVVVPAATMIVDNVETTHRELVAAGVEFIQPPQVTPWKPKVRFAVLIDSENNSIVIEEPAEDEPDDEPL